MKKLLTAVIIVGALCATADANTITRRDTDAEQYDVCDGSVCWLVTDAANDQSFGAGRLQIREMRVDAVVVSAWPMGYHVKISESPTGALTWIGNVSQGHEGDRSGQIILVDGVETVLARGASASGTAIELRQVTVLYGATDPLMSVEQSYTWDSGVFHHTWTRTGLAHFCIWYEYAGIFGAFDRDTVVVDGVETTGLGAQTTATVTLSYDDASQVDIVGSGEPTIRLTADVATDLLVYDHASGKIVPYFVPVIAMAEVYQGDVVSYGYTIEVDP